MQDKPDFLQKYDEIIQDQCKKGIIEKIPPDSGETGIKHYIPHHAVIDPTKPTTKIRIVYDASAKSKQGNLSLNECLHRGPVMLQDLCGLLMRFRINRIGIVADIEKAFLQVGLQVQDRNATRFFWLKDVNIPSTDNNIQVYRFCRVPFGVISSPFLLAATVDHHLSTYDSETAEQIRNNIYVDNVITGVDNIIDAENLYKDSKHIFQAMSMNLRDWASNNQEFYNLIPELDRSSREKVKVLGLMWTLSNDLLTVPCVKCDNEVMPITKREVLQRVASIYDPLGFFSPVTLKSKLFLQMLWRKNLEWDEQLADEDVQQWKEISTDLQDIPQCNIPRYIGLQGETTCRLLCFCDASTKAYATSVYLQMCNMHTETCNLVFSKTRLAPNDKISLPRLELLAVLIGVRSMSFVETQLKLTFSEKILWTDSQCVLHWIKTEKLLTVFVENRLREIRKHSDIEFQYVSTRDNPVDIASRGTTVSYLKENKHWWNGPLWLTQKRSEWPTWKLVDKGSQEAIESEYRSPKVLFEAKLLAGEGPNGKLDNKSPEFDNPFCMNVEKFSSFTRLLRVSGWILRFIRKLKGDKIPPGPLTPEELHESQVLWIKYLQDQHYKEVKTALTGKTRHNLVSQLGLVVDEEGLIRCVGRLGAAHMTEGARQPILLPKRNHVTDLLIESLHRKSFHVGVSQTLSLIRQKYWIPQGRSEVKRILRKCTVCKKYEGGPYKMPLMPPLPKKRVNESAPFTYTGVDYFGPIYVKAENGSKKVWVCLYTCLVVRAIHMELMLDMSAEEFLLGLRRFIARWEKPKQLISDNASQFKLSSSVL